MTVSGGDGADGIFGPSDGSGGPMTIDGGGDPDDLQGGGRRDLIVGGPGDDSIRATPGRDEMAGGDGTDRISFASFTTPVTAAIGEGGIGADVETFAARRSAATA